MKPGILQPILIQRGLYWRGFQMNCFADRARTALRDLTGWTPCMDVRRKEGLPVLFRFALTLGETQGRVIVQPMTGEQTAELPVGVYVTALAFVDDQGRELGTYAVGEVRVVDVITVPVAAS